jgi:hypothetical protein
MKEIVPLLDLLQKADPDECMIISADLHERHAHAGPLFNAQFL